MPSGLGFITIDRGIQDWQFYGSMSIRGFWLYLIMKANWKDRWIGKGIKVKRGSFVSTFARMAEENEASEKTIRKYLKLLEDAGQITVETSNKYTHVTVVNYDEYQTGSELCEGKCTDQNPLQSTDQSTDQRSYQRSYRRKKEKKENKETKEDNAREAARSSSSEMTEEEKALKADLLKKLKGD